MESIIVFLVIAVIAIGMFSYVTSKRNSSSPRKTSQQSIQRKFDRPVCNEPVRTTKTKTRQILESGYARKERLTIKYATGDPSFQEVSIKTRNVDIYGLGDDYISHSPPLHAVFRYFPYPAESTPA